MLDGGEFEPEVTTKEGFEYYTEDGMELGNKTYRLVWLLKNSEVYIGVINCDRRD